MSTPTPTSNSANANRREKDRYPLMQPIGLSIAGRILTGELFDLSEAGAKVRMDIVDAMGFTMMKGDEAILKIALFSNIPCSVAWVDDNYLGLELDESDVVLSMIEVECSRDVNRVAV